MDKFFALKLVAPRPTFAFDMTDDERSIMQEHSDYWRKLMKHGKVIVFGPVMDPNGPYGLGVVRLDTEEELNDFMHNDPASKLCSYEHHPIMAVIPENNI